MNKYLTFWFLTNPPVLLLSVYRRWKDRDNGLYLTRKLGDNSCLNNQQLSPGESVPHKKKVYDNLLTIAHLASLSLYLMSAPTLLSEAKSIHQSLKELLKTKEPFDKEVDFQRKK